MERTVQTTIWQLECLVATKRASKGPTIVRRHVTLPINFVTKRSLAFATHKRVLAIDACFATRSFVIFLPLTTTKFDARTFDATFYASTVHFRARANVVLEKTKETQITEME